MFVKYKTRTTCLYIEQIECVIYEVLLVNQLFLLVRLCL